MGAENSKFDCGPKSRSETGLLARWFGPADSLVTKQDSKLMEAAGKAKAEAATEASDKDKCCVLNCSKGRDGGSGGGWMGWFQSPSSSQFRSANMESKQIPEVDQMAVDEHDEATSGEVEAAREKREAVVRKERQEREARDNTERAAWDKKGEREIEKGEAKEKLIGRETREAQKRQAVVERQKQAETARQLREERERKAVEEKKRVVQEEQERKQAKLKQQQEEREKKQRQEDEERESRRKKEEDEMERKLQMAKEETARMEKARWEGEERWRRKEQEEAVRKAKAVVERQRQAEAEKQRVRREQQEVMEKAVRDARLKVERQRQKAKEAKEREPAKATLRHPDTPILPRAKPASGALRVGAAVPPPFQPKITAPGIITSRTAAFGAGGGGKPGGVKIKARTKSTGLLGWAQRMTQGFNGVNVTNFTKSWVDGLAFAALLYAYHPKAIDLSKISKTDSMQTLQHAFDAAEKVGVAVLLDAEDLIYCDKKSIYTQMTVFANELGKKTPDSSARAQWNAQIKP